MRLAVFAMVVLSAAAQTPTTTSVSVPPAVAGALASITATISPASAVGKVTFIDEQNILGTAPVSNSQATLPVRFRKPGRHAIRAVYLPSAGFSGSSGDTSVLVTVHALPRSFAARVVVPGWYQLLDLNRDTLLDYMPPGALNKIDARLQNADGSFDAVKTSDIGFGRIPLGYGDFDNDGRIDALAEESGQTLAISGAGDGTWTQSPVSPQRTIMPVGHRAALTLDLNRDGRQDIVAFPIASTLPGLIGRYFYGNGTGGFTSAGTPGDTNPIGDLNGDDIADMITLQYPAPGGVLPPGPPMALASCKLVLSSPTGYFVGPDCGLPVFLTPSSVVARTGDVNGDGHRDLVFLLMAVNQVYVRYGSGGGAFGPAVAVDANAAYGPLDVVDINGDGESDILGYQGNSLFVRLSGGNGDFSTLTIPTGGIGAGGAEVTEWNGDGIPDIRLRDAIYLGNPTPPPAILQSSSDAVLPRGATKTFSVTATDGGGPGNITSVSVRIGVQPACEVEVSFPSRVVRLMETGASAAAGWVVDPWCAVNATDVQVSLTASAVTVAIPVMLFPPTSYGPPDIYFRIVNASGSETGYQKTASATWGPAPENRAPTGTGLNIAAANAVYNVTFSGSDPDGLGDVEAIGVLINQPAGRVVQGCVIQVISGSSITLANDAGTDWLPWQPLAELTPSSVLSNSQCTVQSGKLTRTYSGPYSVSYTVPVLFRSSFSGPRTATLYILDTAGLGSLQSRQVQVTIGSTVALPSVAVQPKSGSGVEQVFRATYTGAEAGSDLSKLYLIVADSVTSSQLCFAEFDAVANTMRLLTSAGWSAPVTQGVSGTVSSANCTLNAGLAGRQASVNSVSIGFGLRFSAHYTGTKNIFVLAQTIGGESTNWISQGTWTIPATTGEAKPSVESLTPVTGTGAGGTFTAVFSHGTAATELYLGYILFLPVPNVVQYTARGSCLIEYNRISHGIRLINDPGDGWLGPISGVPIQPQAPLLSNSQCTVDVARASSSLSGNHMTVNVPVTFKAGFRGVLPSFLQSVDVHDHWTGMTQMGSWQAAEPPARRPGPYVTTSSFGGSSNVGTAVVRFGHTSGTSNIGLVHLLVNSTIVGGAPCHIVYSPAANAFNLINDGGTAMVSENWMGVKANGILANSRCDFQPVLANRRDISAQEMELTIIMRMNTPAYAGRRNAYVNVFDNAGSLTHWTQIGSVVFE